MLPSAQNSRHELGHLAAVHLSLGDYVLTGAGYLQALPMRLWGTANQCQSAYCNAALARKKVWGVLEFGDVEWASTPVSSWICDQA
jgi:hypothetical protein